jgi:hypothetical protein
VNRWAWPVLSVSVLSVMAAALYGWTVRAWLSANPCQADAPTPFAPSSDALGNYRLCTAEHPLHWSPLVLLPELLMAVPSAWLLSHKEKVRTATKVALRLGGSHAALMSAFSFLTVPLVRQVYGSAPLASFAYQAVSVAVGLLSLLVVLTLAVDWRPVPVPPRVTASASEGPSLWAVKAGPVPLFASLTEPSAAIGEVDLTIWLRVDRPIAADGGKRFYKVTATDGTTGYIDSSVELVGQ